MLNIAKDQGLISEMAYKQADAIKFMGNKSAHPIDDDLLNVGESDVRQGLQMARRVLLEVYDKDKLAIL